MNDIAFAPIREVAVGLPNEDHFSTAATVSGMMGILMSESWPKRANDPAWQHALATCTRAIQLETDTREGQKSFRRRRKGRRLKGFPGRRTEAKNPS
ncbi:hypothetical protein PZB21_25875 [Rhizobium sp. CBK13]|uniref:hypothetical protein n=1 Tax=Rhizobium sp. CBK13 TaxID=3031399 RepID=UPI0023B1C27D|nr:hypothetical protein [Rhizobium sp. CBK13]MDE8762605.1 hypothetical protein [Rhizobium sp. CBK13]